MIRKLPARLKLCPSRSTPQQHTLRKQAFRMNIYTLRTRASAAGLCSDGRPSPPHRRHEQDMEGGRSSHRLVPEHTVTSNTIL